MVGKLIVVGIGPGSSDYIIPAATRAIQTADVLVGGRRALESLAPTHPRKIYITGKLDVLETELSGIEETAKVVVLVSGDPGYYSLLPWLKKTFPIAKIEVIPGLSSVQVAFARIGEVWQDANLLSFHGRTPTEADLVYAKGKKLSFLTDMEHNPGYICRELLHRGWPKDTKVSILERISYDDERKREGTLEDCADERGFAHSVMVVRA